MSYRLQDEVELVFYGTTGAQPATQPSFQARPHLVVLWKKAAWSIFKGVCCAYMSVISVPRQTPLMMQPSCIADLDMAHAGTKNNLDDQQPGEWPHVTVTLPLMHLRVLCTYTLTQ